MIRRFLYRSWWNFYDYLGTYFFSGTAATFVLLGITTGGAEIGQSVGSSVVRLAVYAGSALLVWAILAAVLGGLMAFSNKAAQDLPARFSDIATGARRLYSRYLLVLFIVSLGTAIILANMSFYSSVARGVGGTPALLLTALSAAFLWLGLAFGCYCLSLLAVAAKFDEQGHHARGYLKRSFMYLALAPGLWLFVFAGCAGFTVLCILSRVGIIFILPFLACGASTAAWLVEQHSELLAEAREQIGPNKPLRAYKAKAKELGWDWELRQPRRTLREILKPWEY